MSVSLKLSKPIQHDGKPLASLALDFDALTGADVLMCEREAVIAAGSLVLNMRTSGQMHTQLAARASGLPVEALMKFSARDFIAVMELTQGFLLESG